MDAVVFICLYVSFFLIKTVIYKIEISFKGNYT